MASTIGIKIANGDFYSILEENSQVKKKLVLTTVHNRQKSAQIDLYKSYTKTMADALYIGSLVIENISPKVKGDPSIELIINSNEDGEITADAYDRDTASKEHQYLTVSLKSFDDETAANIPDFELEELESSSPPRGLYERYSSARNGDKKGTPLLIVLIVGLVLILLCLLLWFFFFRGKKNVAETQSSPVVVQTQMVTQQPVPPVVSPVLAAPLPEPPASSRPSVQPSLPAAFQSGPSAPSGAPPVITAPAGLPVSQSAALRTRPVPPVASYKVPVVIPKDGAVYRIRWGDTLWDIAESFYRNPWLYPRIARYNSIRNPDLIISGTNIRVPSR
ncbi:MAG: LysM peptidoglycan-binding domain-containing protein [Treponema sp.]|jgi:hypothetical protein|nr:LysM peptidoglycan-binding domain-containing protein [Treponema sp.]